MNLSEVARWMLELWTFLKWGRMAQCDPRTKQSIGYFPSSLKFIRSSSMISLFVCSYINDCHRRPFIEDDIYRKITVKCFIVYMKGLVSDSTVDQFIDPPMALKMTDFVHVLKDRSSKNDTVSRRNRRVKKCSSLDGPNFHPTVVQEEGKQRKRSTVQSAKKDHWRNCHLSEKSKCIFQKNCISNSYVQHHDLDNI